MNRQSLLKNCFIILLMIIGFSIVYFSCTSKHLLWNVKLDNLNILSRNVMMRENDIKIQKKDVYFDFLLKDVGDYYDFSIDVFNDGDIDAIFVSFQKEFSIDGKKVLTLPDNISFLIKDSNDLEVNGFHQLKRNKKETYYISIHLLSNDSLNPIRVSGKITPQYLQNRQSVFSLSSKKKLYDVLKTEAENKGLALEYNGKHQDSFTQTSTEKIYHWFAENDEDGEKIREKNNVFFAGFCWQILRTTDTGGVKLIYNGILHNGGCDNWGEETSIGVSSFNLSDSPAYVGYMYQPEKLIVYKDYKKADSGSLFGTGVTYSDGKYTLMNPSSSYDENHHYTCNNKSGECNVVRYYYYSSSGKDYYMELKDGRDLDQALIDMLSSENVNQTDSIIKKEIDKWYQNHLMDYTEMLENVIYCNNRNIYHYGGWDPNGGNKDSFLRFHEYGNFKDLSCSSVVDQFSVENDYAKLTYPIALATSGEMDLFHNKKAIETGQYYWLLSPITFNSTHAYVRNVKDDGDLFYFDLNYELGIRPVISLKKDTTTFLGDGSKNNPYVIG